MSKYTQEVMLIDTELDEIGRGKSLNRFVGETQINFKDRIYLSTIKPPRPNIDYYTFASCNHMNLFQKKIFSIELVDSVLDPNSLPRIEILGNSIEIWRKQNEDSVLKIHFDNPKYRFMKDLKNALEKLDFIKVELFEYEDFLETKNLLQKNSDRINSEIFLVQSQIQIFNQKYIDNYSTNNPIASYIEKNSKEEIASDGEYFLDKINGLLYTNVENKGFATIMYQDFPFIVEWSPIKILELNDESCKSLFYKNQINEEGKPYLNELNSYGAKNINEILKDNRLYWDK